VRHDHARRITAICSNESHIRASGHSRFVHPLRAHACTLAGRRAVRPTHPSPLAVLYSRGGLTSRHRPRSDSYWPACRRNLRDRPLRGSSERFGTTTAKLS